MVEPEAEVVIPVVEENIIEHNSESNIMASVLSLKILRVMEPKELNRILRDLINTRCAGASTMTRPLPY